MDILIVAGRDLEVLDTSFTDLHRASCDGNTDIVRLLLDAGANPKAQKKDGRTALHWASLSDNVEIVKLLLAAGADKNLKSYLGLTASDIASYRGNLEIVNLLE